MMLEVLITIFGFINLFYENNTSNTFACGFFLHLGKAESYDIQARLTVF